MQPAFFTVFSLPPFSRFFLFLLSYSLLQDFFFFFFYKLHKSPNRRIRARIAPPCCCRPGAGPLSLSFRFLFLPLLKTGLLAYYRLLLRRAGALSHARGERDWCARARAIERARTDCVVVVVHGSKQRVRAPRPSDPETA
jgi:hypothetical protein